MRLKDHFTNSGELDCLPYSDCGEHLIDELNRLDLLINLQVLRRRHADEDNSLRQFKGLVISDEEITGLLSSAGASAARRTDCKTSDENEEISEQALSELETNIDRKRTASLRNNIFLPLAFLSEAFHLTPLEEQCLIICIAPELDQKYEKFYGYLHDDIMRRQPSVGLVLELLCGSIEDKIRARRFFDQSAPLFRHQLLHFIIDPSNGSHTLLSRSLKINERIANLLLDLPGIDNRLQGIVSLADFDESLDLVTLPPATRSRLKDLVSSHFSTNVRENKNLLLYFHGPYGTGKQSLAKSICTDLGVPLLIIDLGKLAGSSLPMEELVRLIAREATLRPSALCLRNFDTFIADDDIHQRVTLLKEMLRESSRLIFLMGRKPWSPPEFDDKEIFISLEFPVPDDRDRKLFWKNKSSEVTRTADGIDF